MTKTYESLTREDFKRINNLKGRRVATTLGSRLS